MQFSLFNTLKVNKQFPSFLAQNQLNFDVERFVVAQTMINPTKVVKFLTSYPVLYLRNKRCW